MAAARSHNIKPRGQISTAKLRSGPIDWLEQSDQWMKAYPKFRNWSDWILPFYVVRYPFLRPEPPAPGSLECDKYSVGELLFERELRNWEKRLWEQTPEVVQRLAADQRVQLAALVWQCAKELQTYRQVIGPLQKRQAKIGREGERRVQVLRRKLDVVLRRLEDLRSYSSGLDEQYGFQDMPSHVNLCLTALRKFTATKGLADEFRKCREMGQDPNKDPALFHDPTTECMVSVYWFFRHECSLPGDEAEVRTGRIRNAHWSKWIRRVAFIPEYDREQSIGCGAVHVAVLRYSQKMMTKYRSK